MRLWEGQGVLTTTIGAGDPMVTPDGTLAANEWLGTYDALGNNRHEAAQLQDSRDGASPRMKFGLPHIDLETYEALKADQALAKDRDLVIYRAIFGKGEGLRPQTPIQFAARLTMKSVEFTRRMSGRTDSPEMEYSARVLLASGEEGRSRIPGATYTDTAQRERAAQLGVASDSGCVFIARNAQRTFVIGGDR
ncbi:hypothetical protein JI664_12580 [Rhodobacter sp. NTK016B]|uniref:hypothetical protein n=1 Tax=Rhodobacter sp. NTK016B TaxID=2759676 RepID=UPI001A8CF3ED|nr:hypothetical protein [Rhodobacter sp. NTK016B]MBN8292802.1 hypothetical protein [Rhodobacter sp. NTK016B]